MENELELWAISERQCIKDDLTWLRGGARLLSPSGDDITAAQIARLVARLEHAEKALNGLAFIPKSS